MAKKLEGIPNLLNNLTEYEELTFGELVTIFEGSFQEGENQAKARAPWTDRTGQARASIANKVVVDGKENITGVLGIGVFYGVYLELSERFRIIRPTLFVMQEAMKDLFAKIRIKDFE
jgi:hypothetical protein